MKKVLITGVNGFVGSNIANYMVEKGYDVVGLYRRKVDRYNSKIRYVQCDLSEPIQLKEHFDAVIHLASQVENAQVYDYVVNTTMATANLISYCENVKVDFFILASSIAIYGETDIEVDESSDRKNVEPYGMAKIFAEQLLMNSSIPTKIILRLPRVLGVGADLSCKWLPNLTLNLKNNNPIKYFNRELEYNNMMDVDDLAAFCNRLMIDFWGKNSCEEFVLGAKDKMKILDIVYFLKSILESDSELIDAGKGNTTVFSIDISKALKYGYNPMETKEVLQRFAKYVMAIDEAC